MGVRFTHEGVIRLLTILGTVLIEVGLILLILEMVPAGLICFLAASSALLVVVMMFRSEEKR